MFLDHLHDKNIHGERNKVAEYLYLFPADVDKKQQFPVVVGVSGIRTYGM